MGAFKSSSSSPGPEPDKAMAEKSAGPSRVGARAQSAPLISDDLKDQAIEALRVCLSAEKRFWSKTANEWVSEPDYAARIRAAELTLAYAEGRPVERKFELRGDVETFEDRKKQIMASPEGVKFLRAAGAISAGEASEALANIIEGSQE